MHLVCCADEVEQCAYIMELMDMILSKMLENSQLSLVRGVDVMLQIAEGSITFIAWTWCIVISKHTIFLSSVII